MALQQDTVSIDLAQGVNNKVDDKIAGPEQTSVLRNARFDKDKRLQKRNGLTAQSTNFIGNFEGEKNPLNPIVFSLDSCKTKTFVHQDQLCLETNGYLFSQYDSQDVWVYKGTYVPIEIDVNRLDANVNFTDAVTVMGVTVSCGSQSIYVSEESTGTIISRTLLANTEFTLRPIGFSDGIFVLTNSSASSVLAARRINLANGVVGSQITVASDYRGYAYPPNLTVTSSASAIGEAAFIVYNGASNDARMRAFLSVGSTSSLPALILASISAQMHAITVEPINFPNRIYIAGQTGAQSFTVGSTNYVNNWYSPYIPAGLLGNISTNSYHAITLAVDPNNNLGVYVYIDFYPTQTPLLLVPGAVDYSNDNTITLISINTVGGATSNDVYSRGLSIAGYAFRDNIRKTIYLPCVYKSPLQTTILLCDTLEGRNRFNYFTGKTLYGEAASFIPVPGGVNLFNISQTYSVSTNTYRIINNRYFVDFNLTPDNAPQDQFYANTTHLTGGFLWSFDGDTMAEHNFLIGPEQMEVDPGAESISITIDQQGDGSKPEVFTVSPDAAPAYAFGGSQNRYVRFNTTTGTVSLYFLVDGIGTNPNLAGAQNIPVPLTVTDRAIDVAIKLMNAVNGGGVAATAIQILGGPYVQITNSINGDVPNPSADGTNRPGSLGGGSYQYTYVYQWTDKSGNQYRSLTAPPVTRGFTGSSGAAIILWAPPLTNKTIKDVKVELYRTLVNGTTFHYLDTIISMASSSARVGFFDGFSDSSISGNRILYTTGGVLDNYNIGAVKSVSFFKERLQVTGVDDKFAIYYSKKALPGEPVNFAAETFYRVDADLTPVTTIAQMDDKSIIFKPNLVYAVSGDGANDLGEGSTLSPPLLVASDSGTSIPNSVVLYPNGLLYKSDKGIYNLNRSIGVEYVGAPVEDFNSYRVSDASLMKTETEIRFTHQDTSTALVYNYYFNRWDYFDNYQCDSATVWNGDIALSRSNGKVFLENSYFYDVDGGSQSYSIYLETPWLKLKGIQDFQRIYSFMFLGEYLSAHTVSVNVSYDYDNDESNSTTYDFNSAETIGNPPISGPAITVYQFQVNLERQKCESIKVKFTEHPATANSQSSLYLNNMSAYVGLKKGLDKIPADKNT